MSPSGHLRRSTSIAVRSAVTNCWSMKPSLMPPLAWRNSAVNIRAGCPRLGVQDVTAILWSTSIKSHSPPRGRYVHHIPSNRTVPVRKGDPLSDLYLRPIRSTSMFHQRLPSPRATTGAMGDPPPRLHGSPEVHHLRQWAHPTTNAHAKARRAAITGSACRRQPPLVHEAGAHIVGLLFERHASR